MSTSPIPARPINAAAVDLVKHFEGFVPHWYPDPAHGWSVPTCCYGHTDAAGEPKYAATKSKQFTEAEGVEILARDLAVVGRSVSALLKRDVTDNQFGALVSFTFNLGVGTLEKSTLLKRVNDGQFDAAAKEFGKWVNAGGKKLDGLVRRRAAEAALFASDGPTVQPAPEAPPAASPWVALLQFLLNLIKGLRK